MENIKQTKDIVKLPSLGKLYTPKTETLELYHLDGEDEDIITSPSIGGDIRILFKELIKNKLVDKTFKIDKLIPADRDKIIIFLRVTAYGPIYDFVAEDPITGEPFNSSINLNEAIEKTLDIDPDENNLFTIIINENDFYQYGYESLYNNVKNSKTNILDKEIKFKLLTVGDYEAIENDMIAKSKAKNTKVAKYATILLREQIHSIDGETDKSKIETILMRASITERVILRELIKSISPSITLEKEVMSPSGQFFRVNPEFNIRFIYPF